MNFEPINLQKNHDLIAENWAKMWIEKFEEIGVALQALCGVVVLFSEEEQGFFEQASFGYPEEGFFYEFLKSDGSDFQKVANSPSPVIYQKKDKIQVFHRATQCVVVCRVYPQEMKGFILLEFPSDTVLEGTQTLIYLYSETIAQGLRKNSEKSSKQNLVIKEESESHKTIRYILDLASNWDGRVELIELKKIFYLLVEKGKIKNRSVKYFHKILQREGELLFINYLPEQVGKFEKSLKEWLKIARDGTLVIERCSELEPSHQRIFLENINNNVENVLYIFWDEPENEMKKTYPPFQKLLQENTIKIQRFSSLEHEKRLFILEGLFKEVCNLGNRKKMHISNEALRFLDQKSQDSDLGEIESVLETAVLRCKEFELTQEVVERVWNEKATLTALLDMEELDLRKSVEALERQKILLAHRLFSGNQLRMAKALGISRGSLQYKMKQMGI